MNERLSRFVDFQISIGSMGGLTADERRPFAGALFASYEPVRLWLKARTLKAPFQKFLVRFEDEAHFTDWHGRVSVLFGICTVWEAVSPSACLENASNHRWVVARVQHAVACVAKELGWRSQELEDMLEEMAEKPFPLMHFFDKLARTDRRTGITCRPFMSMQPGFTEVGVHIVAPDGTEQDRIILSKHDPIWLEDDFPMAKAKIQDGAFLLLDKTGTTLATVPLHDPAAG